MRIDVHAHYWTDDHLDRMAGLGKTDTATQRGTGAGGGAELAAESFGADRLVLGTDFPYETGDIFVRAVDYISAADLPAGQAEAILERNAMELLGISR